MLFKTYVARVIIAILTVLQRVILLILYPYKTMRKISYESDYFQIVIIFGGVYIYLHYANILREYHYEPGILFLLTLFHFVASVFFFHLIASVFGNKNIAVKPFIFTLAYAMIPTILWLAINSSLYIMLPPPRTISLLGKAFSIIYISFSIAFFAWKIILEYLAVRFASKMPFYQIMYSLLLYLVVLGPYFFWMYAMNFFRMPII